MTEFVTQHRNLSRSTKYLFAILLFTSKLVLVHAGIETDTPDTSIYFNEVNGLVVAEIESLNPSSGWVEKADINGFTGTSFFEWKSNDYFNTPGNGLLNYTIKINTPGVYGFQWHCKVGEGTKATEANDTWLKIPDAKDFFAVKPSNNDTVRPKGVCTTDCPDGSGSDGWFKVYSTGTTNWTWSGKTSDGDPHNIYAKFDSAGFYTVQISGRSRHHLIDRFVLHSPSVNNPTNLAIKETKVSYLSNNKAKVIFKIANESTSSPISSAKVSLLGKSKYTDKAGYTFHYEIPIDTTIKVDISKSNYYNVNDSIKVQNDTIIQINLKELPDTTSELTFQVKDSLGFGIQQAKITVGDTTKYTLYSGIAVFSKLQKENFHIYSIQAENYYSIRDSVKINKDTSVTIVMKELPDTLSDITFRVKDTLGKAIPKAKITLGGTTIQTSPSGIALFSDLQKEIFHIYNIQADNYLDIIDSVKVFNDSSITVVMNELPDTLSDLTFNITDAQLNVMDSVKITIGNVVKLTDLQGTAIFYDLLNDSTYSFSIQKNDYIEISGNIKVSADTNIDYKLQKKSSSSQFIDGASNNILIKPNPVVDVLHISSENAIKEIDITNLEGKVLSSNKNLNIKDIRLILTNYKSGLYILKVKFYDNSKPYIGKFLKIDATH